MLLRRVGPEGTTVLRTFAWEPDFLDFPGRNQDFFLWKIYIVLDVSGKDPGREEATSITKCLIFFPRCV